MPKRIFIDTGAFLALEDESDEHHGEALQFRDEALLKGNYEMITTSYILDETLTLIRARLGIKGKFKVAAVAVALVALLTAVGGLVISQAAGGQSGIRATVYDDAVRFAIQNEKVSILRAEVFNLSGKRLFDSGPTMGNTLDWAMTTEAGERVAHD